MNVDNTRPPPADARRLSNSQLRAAGRTSARSALLIQTVFLQWGWGVGGGVLNALKLKNGVLSGSSWRLNLIRGGSVQVAGSKFPAMWAWPRLTLLWPAPPVLSRASERLWRRACLDFRRHEGGTFLKLGSAVFNWTVAVGWVGSNQENQIIHLKKN